MKSGSQRDSCTLWYISLFIPITNTQKNQMSIDGWKDKENVEYVYSRILFSHDEEGNLPFVTTWMDHENIMLEWNKPQTQKDKYYTTSYMRNLKQLNSKSMSIMVDFRGFWEGEWKVLINKSKYQLWKMNKFQRSKAKCDLINYS